MDNSAWSHCLQYCALTDVGLRRANNQDAYAVDLAGSQADFQRRGHFFMVADGMGAHAAGELASKMATDIVSLVYRKRIDQSPHEAILAAILDANHQIHHRGLASPDFRGMGTTATTLLLLPTGALVAHVGDSRAYLLHGTRIEQLTFDHSLVWELRAAGQSPEAELSGYISKNIITRSLGPNPAVQIDLEGPYPVQAGDTLLLCTDGLSGQVKDDEIGLVLESLPPKEAAQTLVEMAKLRGGPDNITVIVVRVLGPQIARNTSADSSRVASVVRQPVHPLIWTVIGAASLAAVGLLAMGHRLLALLSMLSAAAAVIAAVMQRYGINERRYKIERRRFGKGPHVVAECQPSADLASRLASLVDQLRQSGLKEGRANDWGQIDGLSEQAASALAAGNAAEAVRGYLAALSRLAAEFRQLPPARDSNSVL